LSSCKGQKKKYKLSTKTYGGKILAVLMLPQAGEFDSSSRLLKNAHLLRCAHPASLQRTKSTPHFA
jgi:hypothetical protein